MILVSVELLELNLKMLYPNKGDPEKINGIVNQSNVVEKTGIKVHSFSGHPGIFMGASRDQLAYIENVAAPSYSL